MSKEKKSSEEIKKGRRKKVAAVVLAVLVVLLAILLYLLLGKDEPRIISSEEDVAAIAENQEQDEPIYYDVTMNGTWDFANGKAGSDNAYVENADTNENPVEFEVVRTDTGDTVYKSPILEVGAHMEKSDIVLDADLPGGTYPCRLTYYLLNDEHERIDDQEVTLTLTINVRK